MAYLCKSHINNKKVCPYINILIERFELEEFGIWEEISDFLVDEEAQPEEEKFPEAKSFEEIVATKDKLKSAIEHQLFNPTMLLKRTEELYPDDMKARVRRLIDVLDFWQ